MNSYDLFAFILIGGCTYFGYKTGIIASLFYILSGFAGMWAAQSLVKDIDTNFYVIFFMCSGVVVFAGFFLSKILRKLFLGTVDHAGGAGFGFLLGFVIFALVIFPFSKTMSYRFRKLTYSSYSVRKIIPKFRKMFPNIREFDVEEMQKALPPVEIPKEINLEVDAHKINKTLKKKIKKEIKERL